MNFEPETRRAQTESIVPMINVVFLLLIFFLMTSEIAPPEPFAVAPPTAATEEQADGVFTLFLSAEGALAYQDDTGEEAALEALKTALDDYCAQGGCSDDVAPPPILLRADQSVAAHIIATLMPKLGSLGFKETHLITAIRTSDAQ
jgi:biopolymer transport protein ExbD